LQVELRSSGYEAVGALCGRFEARFTPPRALLRR
jgi:hypothetical protein